MGKKLRRRWAIGLFLCVAAGLALPSPAVAQDTQAQKAIGELLDVFTDFCLKRFPDDAAIETYVTGKGVTPMPEARLRNLLGTNPGIGWLLTAAFGEYQLTIEKPPYHTCAVRKQFPRAPDVRASYAARLQSWVATRPGANMSEQPPLSPTISGIVSRAFIFEITLPGGPPNETLMAIITPLNGGGAEVRLARAIGNR